MRRGRGQLPARGTALGAAMLVGAASLVVGRAGASAAALPVASGNPLLAPFESQPARWHECQVGPNDAVGGYLDAVGAQCADVSVPLDYARPTGRTITLGLARIRAVDQAHRRGPLMVNLGGPGGGAVDAIADIRAMLGPVADRFDLVAMDPRFVGRSSALDCGPALGADWLRAAGPDRDSFERVADEQAATAAGCSSHADVLPFASTRNTARDMDVVRAVLGAATTSYLGYSYGTYLGAVYMQMFPDRVDRFVLDSVVDPATYTPRVLRGSGDLLEAALGEWAAWAAGQDAQLALGRTAAQVLRTVDRIYQAAARRPLTVDGVRYDASDVPRLLIASLTDDSEDAAAVLAMGVRAFADAADGRAPATNPYLAEFLQGLATDGPALPGARAHAQAGTDAGPGGSVVSAFQSAQLAVLCGDVPAPRIAGDYLADIRRHTGAQRHVAGAIWNITPCAYWPVRPVEPPTRVANAVPALVVAAEKDNRTPYAGARALHRVLSASRLVTLRDARVHGVYPGRSGCVDGAVNAYLQNGTLPRADVTCTRPPAAVGSPPQ
ncbi:alpha/beta hydrolase [Parafrankia sp. EUN1f]|uniref:alpha/beta hydrolase n=1 Tax=Parafrankia sp. EUN1f TaxID=102897 RepID=UPI0001C4564B|nr:alpha/beta hydrolase [Parafrankia sp. EUN1f]EFC83234.1 TAP domain protein [Parafrankia sp. EUN1f]